MSVTERAPSGRPFTFPSGAGALGAVDPTGGAGANAVSGAAGDPPGHQDKRPHPSRADLSRKAGTRQR